METIVEEMSLNLFSPPRMTCKLTKLKEIYCRPQIVSPSSNKVYVVNAMIQKWSEKIVLKPFNF
jgi:hypothetical protein